MPKITSFADEFDDEPSANNQFKSARREAQRRAKRPRGRRSGGGREHQISVRSEHREQPDMRRIARAVIQIALARAETEARATGATQNLMPSEEAGRE
jgi:hypothetical protein